MIFLFFFGLLYVSVSGLEDGDFVFFFFLKTGTFETAVSLARETIMLAHTE